MSSKLTNYPNGFPNGVVIKGVPLLVTAPGNVIWVNNTGAAVSATANVRTPTGFVGGNDNGGMKWGRSPDKPFASIRYAITQARPQDGDIIMVAPGHIEDISVALTTGAGTIAAGTIALSTAGIKIIGLGTGNDRPQIKGLAGSATFTITGAGCVVQNFIFPALNTGTTVGTFKITVQASDCVITENQFFFGTSDLSGICVQIGSDRIRIDNNEFYAGSGGNGGQAIKIDGGVVSPIIRYNWFDGFSLAASWSAGMIYSSGQFTRALIEHNNGLYTSAGMIQLYQSGATGVIRENFSGASPLTTTFKAAGCYFMNNYANWTQNTSGTLEPSATG